jgi:membrane-associated phospholipid phosphatase
MPGSCPGSCPGGWRLGGPAAVLSGKAAYVPWYLPGELSGEGWWQGGSFPAVSSALAGLIIPLAWQVPQEYREVRRGLLLLAFGLVAASGVLEVYAQHHWPSDVIAGTALGILLPWLLLEKHGAADK